MLIGSTIGVIIRFLICLLFINTSISLFIFGIVNFIDFYQNIKNTLKSNNIADRERNWLPHITIDLYNCKNKNEFIEKLDKIVQNINSFNIEFRNLNNFDNETLYIEPYNKDNLINLKSIFDEELKPYRLERRLKRIYRPHITLCTNNDLSSAYKIANKEFSTFNRNNQVYMVL